MHELRLLLEACPQYAKVELEKQPGETPEHFRGRQDVAFDDAFIGAHSMSQVVLINSHPTGQMAAGKRIDSLIAAGGIQNCGKAANCQAVRPKEIPLMTSWARAGRAATLHVVKKFFDG